jgi:hypothetical protein
MRTECKEVLNVLVVLSHRDVMESCYKIEERCTVGWGGFLQEWQNLAGLLARDFCTGCSTVQLDCVSERFLQAVTKLTAVLTPVLHSGCNYGWLNILPLSVTGYNTFSSLLTTSSSVS